MKEIDQKYIENKFAEKELYAIVYPKDKSEKSAQKIAEMVDSAEGIVKFEDENGVSSWGVIINKVKEVKKHLSQVKKDMENNDSQL